MEVMEMAKFSSDLLNKLTEFLVCEIGSKALDGITYAMILKDPKDKDNYKRYTDIKREAVKCGYKNDEVFRVYEVSNGYIFDMDLNVAKKITSELSKAVAKANNGNTPTGDLIGDSPDKRRKDDMLGLAKYVKQQYDNGKKQIEVALFSRNSVPRIIISGVGPKNDMISIKYNAYAIRHWDIESINANMLIPAGIRIAKLEPCEVLPSKTGVRFVLYVDSV